ncbi:MAG: hypothetical protein J6P76_03990, partial [Acidaminococcaceae bacterium]|nr:hypothetical protein [Acidaminococcaceae bacterium]
MKSADENLEIYKYTDCCCRHGDILLFVLPLTVPIVALKYSAPLVCTAATFAAIQEGHYIRT